MKSRCTVQYKLTDLKKQKTFRPVSNKSAACILLTHCIMYIKLKIVLCIWYYVVPSSRNCLFFFKFGFIIILPVITPNFC